MSGSVSGASTGSRHAAVVQVLVGASLFGTVGVARTLGPEAPGPAVAGVRVALAATVLVLLSSRARRSWSSALRRRPVWAAGVAQAGFQASFLAAVVLTGVAAGTLIAIGTVPLFAGLLHRTVDRRWVAATAVSVAGLVLLVAGGTPVRLEPVGVVLALVAGFSYGAYTVAVGAAVRSGTAPMELTTAAFVVAAVLLAPALLLTDLSWLGTVEGLALVAWLALGATVLSYLLIAHGLRRIAPPVASTLGLAEPVVATVLAVVVLHERPTPIGWLGAALVLLGLAATAVGARRSDTPATAVRGSTP